MYRKPRTTTTNGKLRGAVIGLGNQALSDHIPTILRNDQVQLVAVAELIEAQLEKFTKQYPAIKGYTNYQTLLAAEQPDFVIVSLPHILHYQITRDCIEQGVHVLKEKPGAVSISVLPRTLADGRWNQLPDAHQAGAAVAGTSMRSRQARIGLMSTKKAAAWSGGPVGTAAQAVVRPPRERRPAAAD